ncbi:MAG: type II secretion system protein GspD [Candidatus Dadabacteria bacterium]|nr:MAG: type II secretion system protein GspD [Candidatus Dadabacteria bacterium]
MTMHKKDGYGQQLSWKRRMASLLLAVAIAVSPIGPPLMAAESEMVTIDFRNVDISEFVKTVSKMTGRNFILDQAVRGTVTILGPKPVPVSEVWRIFHTVLAVKGLAVVKVGSLYKIVQRKNAKQQPIPIVFGRKIDSISEEPVVQIVPLEYSDVEEAKKFLDSFRSDAGEILVHEPTNSLIIVDQRNYVARMLKMLDLLDSAESEEVIEILPVRYMAVDNAIKLINDIHGSSASTAAKPTARRSSRNKNKNTATAAGSGLRLVADQRLNRIIAIGTQEDIQSVRSLLQKLDVEEEGAQQKVHVYHLQHADAETLAQTLNSIGSTISKDPKAKGKPKQGSELRIVADKQNNALIFITEDAEELKAQMRLLEKLDVPKSQVFIQAAIVEVSLEDRGEYSLGIAGGAEQTIFGKDGIVGAGRGIDGAQLLNTASLFGTSGIFGGAIIPPEEGSILPPIGIILNALKSNSNTNVLSTPQILTSDNEEAEIVVGDNVPFLTGQTATSGGNVISSIDRRDVGLTLRVTPQVNDSGMVRLKIFQEISDVGQAPQGFDVNQQGLVTKKRSAKTNVVVRNGQTIAIGGLYTTTEAKSESKVPVLGDIPIIGWLFKSRSSTKRRTNLILFLSPNIVRGANELQEISLGLTETFRDRYGDRFGEDQNDFFDKIIAAGKADLAASPEAAFERDMVIEVPDASSEASSPVSAMPGGDRDSEDGAVPFAPTPDAVDEVPAMMPPALTDTAPEPETAPTEP